jgi:uncharacterized protein (TIGR02453 family)
VSDFQGFYSEAFTFFEELEKDNSKTFWEAHKSIWEQKIHQPMQDFLDAFEGEIPPLRIFRPNRDVRFSKDKSPYKLWIGATSEARGVGGVGYYVRLGPTGFSVACGAYVMARDQLERFRDAIDHPISGVQFEEMAHALAALSLPVMSGGEAPLKTVPPGYPKDHPRAEFLRWKGVAVVKNFNKDELWLYTPEAVEKVRAVWRGVEPLKDWLDSHVGPTQESTERTGPRSRKTATVGKA